MLNLDVLRLYTGFPFWNFLRTGQVTQLADMPDFVDAPDASAPFAEHYQRYVRPHVQRFEQERLAMLVEFRRRLMVALPIVALLLLATLIYALLVAYGHPLVMSWFPTRKVALETIEPTLFVCALICGVLGWWSGKPVTAYNSSVKAVIFPQIFSFFGADFAYREKPPISMESLKPSGIIPSYDGARLEDYVRGTHEGVQLELLEAKLTQRQGSGKSRRTVTVFKGVCVVLSMNKYFKGRTMVKKDMGAVGNAISGWVNGLLGGREQQPVQRIHLEDPVFEKQFEVQSTDQVEARYLLTTSFMERLLSVAELFGKGIQASFYDNRLLLMISSPDNRFETASIFQPATFVEDSKTILAEMQAIFGIIDALKLNERTGL
jgi:hypothetical protein